MHGTYNVKIPIEVDQNMKRSTALYLNIKSTAFTMTFAFFKRQSICEGNVTKKQSMKLKQAHKRTLSIPTRRTHLFLYYLLA
jgi:hypothetical protein